MVTGVEHGTTINYIPILNLMLRNFNFFFPSPLGSIQILKMLHNGYCYCDIYWTFSNLLFYRPWPIFYRSLLPQLFISPSLKTLGLRSMVFDDSNLCYCIFCPQSLKQPSWSFSMIWEVKQLMLGCIGRIRSISAALILSHVNVFQEMFQVIRRIWIFLWCIPDIYIFHSRDWV